MLHPPSALSAPAALCGAGHFPGMPRMPEANHPAGYIEITPPVDMSSLKADTPLAITVEAPAESKEDNTPDSKQDEKEKAEKKKSVKKQLSDKKEKAAKTAKPKKVDTKNLGEAI